MKLDLYAIGELVIDFIPGSEEASYIRKAGGAPANVAIAMAKNGLHTGMCAKVGDDDFGVFLQDTLRENGVEVLCPERSGEAVTTMAFVTLKPDGDRVFTFARKPGADMMLAEKDVKEEDILRSVIVHAGSCSLSAQPEAAATIRAMKLAAESGRLVSFDVNYRNVMWKDDAEACAAAVREVLPLVDFLKISEEEVGMMGGEDALPGLIAKYGISLLVETLGADGARVYWNGMIFEEKGIKVKAVDATGAGDAFWGGFLSSLRIAGVEKKADLSEELIRAALRYGNVSGCICVQSKGAIASLPTREQIENYMKEHGLN